MEIHFSQAKASSRYLFLTQKLFESMDIVETFTAFSFRGTKEWKGLDCGDSVPDEASSFTMFLVSYSCCMGTTIVVQKKHTSTPDTSLPPISKFRLILKLRARRTLRAERRDFVVTVAVYPSSTSAYLTRVLEHSSFISGDDVMLKIQNTWNLDTFCCRVLYAREACPTISLYENSLEPTYVQDKCRPIT